MGKKKNLSSKGGRTKKVNRQPKSSITHKTKKILKQAKKEIDPTLKKAGDYVEENPVKTGVAVISTVAVGSLAKSKANSNQTIQSTIQSSQEAIENTTDSLQEQIEKSGEIIRKIIKNEPVEGGTGGKEVKTVI